MPFLIFYILLILTEGFLLRPQTLFLQRRKVKKCFSTTEIFLYVLKKIPKFAV